jgi:hypothetical protein
MNVEISNKLLLVSIQRKCLISSSRIVQNFSIKKNECIYFPKNTQKNEIVNSLMLWNNYSINMRPKQNVECEKIACCDHQLIAI